MVRNESGLQNVNANIIFAFTYQSIDRGNENRVFSRTDLVHESSESPTVVVFSRKNGAKLCKKTLLLDRSSEVEVVLRGD